MPPKISPYKVSKMMALYFDGYSESAIANKLKVNQSTVSLYVSKFKYSLDQHGMKTAGEEYGVMEQVQALNSLAVELKKAKLTVEEAKVGLKMVLLLQKLGIEEEDYKDIIQACTKMESEGYIADAIKLNKLENATGMTHGELLDQYTSIQEELEKGQKDLETTTAKIKAEKEELTNIDKQKKAASQGLKAYMDQIGVDMNRLKLVEGLAKPLKEAGISGKDLEDYIARQQVLNKAGISINTFTSIVEKAKMLISHDQGKELLKALSDYGGINGTIKEAQANIALLKKQTSGLGKMAQQKGKLMARIAELKEEKATLESYVAELYTQKKILDQTKSEIGSLTKKKTQLKEEIGEREAHNSDLIADIEAKEKKVSDLSQLEAKRDALVESISKTEAKLGYEKERLLIFDSFLGFVNSDSIPDLEQFAAHLPYVINLVKQGKESPQNLWAYICNKITGGTLRVWKCSSCHVRFSVDMAPIDYMYHCPRCNSLYPIMTDQDELAILKESLAKLKPQVMVIKRVTEQPQPKPNTTGVDKGVG